MTQLTDPSENKLTDVIHNINTHIVKGVNYLEILNFVFDALSLVVPYDRIGIGLVEKGKPFIRLDWVKSRLPIEHLGPNYRSRLEGSSLQKILQTGKPRIISDLNEYLARNSQSQSTRLILEDGIRSSLTCPLFLDGQSIGLVFFSSHRVDEYRESHIELFQKISNELAVIVAYGQRMGAFARQKEQQRSFEKILHDLRSPLGVIAGFVGLLKDDFGNVRINADNQIIFEALQRNTTFMADLLEDLSAITQLQIEGERPKFFAHKLLLFCQQMADIGRQAALNKGIHFESSFSWTLPETLEFDEKMIRRAVENFFSNAVKFSLPGTRISFSVDDQCEEVIFSVQDQGLGIRSDEIPNLFKEFGRTSTQPTKGETSTGLGLSIVKKMIELHGGRVGVESSLGKGSRFYFALPRAAKKTEEPRIL